MTLNSSAVWSLFIYFKLNVFTSISYCSAWDILSWLPAIRDEDIESLHTCLLSPFPIHCGPITGELSLVAQIYCVLQLFLTSCTEFPSRVGNSLSLSFLCFRNLLVILNLILYLFIWLCQVLILAHGIVYLPWGMWELYLQPVNLSYSMWDLVPLSGIEPRPPALTAWSLSHRTAREVPLCWLVKKKFTNH